LVPAVDRALQEAGLVVRHVQVSPGFARLIVESGDDSTELDLGADASSWPRKRTTASTPEIFAEIAGRFSRLRPDEFGLDRARYEQLERKVLEWQKQARDR
jgi:hypothetical protein